MAGASDPPLFHTPKSDISMSGAKSCPIRPQPLPTASNLQVGLKDCAPLLRRDVGRLLQQLNAAVARQASARDVAGLAARESAFLAVWNGTAVHRFAHSLLQISSSQKRPQYNYQHEVHHHAH